jgi:hypothetical protein
VILGLQSKGAEKNQFSFMHITHKVPYQSVCGSGARSASKLKAGSGSQGQHFPSCGRSKWRHLGHRTPTMEACRLKMKPWKVSRPVVSDAHHFNEEQDLDPYQEEK